VTESETGLTIYARLQIHFLEGIHVARAFYKKKRAILLYVITLLVIYLMLLTPSSQGPWQPGLEKLAYVDIQGRELVVHNIRDFKYSRDQVTESSYITRSYHLDNLSHIWYGISHFASNGLAHSFLSFEFADGDYLVLSVETRLRLGQSYHPVAGALRQFNKIYVWSTERDVIGLRTHIRDERVLLYPITVENQIQKEGFLMALINDTNDLSQKPAFYNTFWDNCLTNLLKHSSYKNDISSIDFRVLLPGHSDGLTYALGITPNDMSLDMARSKASVKVNATTIEAEDFSTMIRCGWHAYENFKLPQCPE